MTSKFLDYSRQASTIISGQMYHLRRLADGFYITGNDTVADALMDIAEMLGRAKSLNDKSANAVLDDMIDSSNALHGTMLNAIMAGIKVAEHIDSLAGSADE